MDKVTQVARAYYCDYADERDINVGWSELSHAKQQYWIQYARRRLERIS